MEHGEPRNPTNPDDSEGEAGTPSPPLAPRSRWWPTGREPVFYGWVVVGGLGVTELVSWGVLVYAFSAFVVPMSAELGWSPGQLNAAYALGIGVSGLVAIPVGRWLTHHGVPMLMTAGSAVTVGVVLAWSQTSSLPVLFLVCAAGGLAMAATLYEPAFVLATRWFNDTTERAGSRARAVLVVTVFGGMASTVFVPLSGALITALGWRDALLVLAVIAAAVGLPIHALVLRDRPRPRSPPSSRARRVRRAPRPSRPGRRRSCGWRSRWRRPPRPRPV